MPDPTRPDPTHIDPTRIEADYLIETAFDPAQAAETMAGEQSSGTFIAVPGETPELRARFAARVERLEVVDEMAAPSLPGAGCPARSASGGPPVWRRARVTLSWPLETLGPSLPNLVATVAGNLFELNAFSGLRLLDLRLPTAFARAHPGPGFGIDGTRRLAGVAGRPLIGTIIKPSVGLSADETGALVGQLAMAGMDFVKDDELQSDGPACPFEDRVRAVMRAVNNAVGWSGMLALGRHTQLPIHAHRTGWGALTRAPALGWAFPAWSKLWRLAGCDHMHVNGLANKFTESDDSVIRSAKSLMSPLFADDPMRAMPVFSSGQTIRQAAGTWAALQNPDLIHTAGGGIMAHPMGPAAGAMALREAWAAAMAGETIEDHARHSPALAAALDTFPA